jgi:hypothetical protein
MKKITIMVITEVDAEIPDHTSDSRAVFMLEPEFTCLNDGVVLGGQTIVESWVLKPEDEEN